MRTSHLICCVSLVLSGSALAQNATGLQGGASSQSIGSVSGDRSDAITGRGSATTAAAAMERRTASHWQGAEMSVTLSRAVDVRKAKPGDTVTATLAQDLRANGRLLLLQGTVLVGRITEAQTRARHSDSPNAHAESRLGIVFERAVLDDGREVPLDATIQAVAVPENGASTGGLDGSGQLTSGSRGVFGLSGVQIVTAATADAHGNRSVLTSQSGNVALERGTRLLLVASGQGG